MQHPVRSANVPPRTASIFLRTQTTSEPCDRSLRSTETGHLGTTPHHRCRPLAESSCLRKTGFCMIRDLRKDTDGLPGFLVPIIVLVIDNASRCGLCLLFLPQDQFSIVACGGQLFRSCAKNKCAPRNCFHTLWTETNAIHGPFMARQCREITDDATSG